MGVAAMGADAMPVGVGAGALGVGAIGGGVREGGAVVRPGEAVPGGPARPARRRRGAHRRPVRLTRRGRAVLAVLLLALLAALFAVVPDRGEAAAPAGAPASVTVREGDTLWSIAERHLPSRDPYGTIDEIRRLNGMDGYGLRTGQRLLIPARG
jgi:LysM repeat protein